MSKQIPNALTVLRFFIIPFIIYYLVKEEYIMAFIMLVLSGLTDILDGFIARKFKLITNFGKLIDPLADKLTQISVLCTLLFKNIIPLWIIVIVLLKEASMVCGASFLYGRNLVVSSRWYGKVATVLFYIAIAVSLIIRQFSLSYSFDIIIYYLALVMTIFSLVMYFRDFYIKGYFKKENLKLTEEIKNNKL